MKTMHLVSLGCPKNLVDSEVMLARLLGRGLVLKDGPEDADLLVVNTCGFIQPAVEETVAEILRLAECKAHALERGRAVRLVVTGCLVQRYGEELCAELPEVDLFVGTDGFERIDELIDRPDGGRGLFVLRPPRFLMNASTPRRISTPPHRAFLKVTEGCDNRCAYCLIPSLRGGLRSRGIDDLVDEARRLEEEGVKELTLIAQDLTAYGKDLGPGVDLVALLNALLAGTVIPWIRLLYLYPNGITDELLRLIGSSPRLLDYLDIPFQHVNDLVLRRMNRRYDRKRIETLLGRIRCILPKAAIRTTLMVGFPGESEAEFEEMASFLKEWRLDHVGVFQYQNEEGCAAHGMAGQCDDAVKQVRHDRLMALQADISLERQQRYVGKIEELLVEGVSEETDLLLEGRTRFQAPDIDGRVYINAGNAEQGALAMARITEAHAYDLVAEIVTGQPGD